MGSITRRVETLEDRSREQAAAEIHRAWEGLSDKEIALVVAPLQFSREPTPQESAAKEVGREVMPEPLIARAIGYSESLPQVEVSRRLRELVDPVLRNRRGRLLRQLEALEREGR